MIYDKLIDLSEEQKKANKQLSTLAEIQNQTNREMHEINAGMQNLQFCTNQSISIFTYNYSFY